jgi:hypothetical protein
MLCDKYKEALIEAAACNAAPSNALRQHIDVCAECRAVFAKEQVLCATIDFQLRDCANAKPSPSFLPRLRARIGVEPTLARRSSVWAAVAASAVLSVTTLLAWKPWHKATAPGTTPTILTSGILPASSEKQSRSESLASTASVTGKSHGTRVSRRDVRDDGLGLLVPASQRAIVDRLIGHIQRGEIDGKVLVSSSRADLQISSIEIPPITASPMLETAGDLPANSGVLDGKAWDH